MASRAIPDDSIGLSSRLLTGALAGVVATAPMTAAMTHLHRGLAGRNRYPLPPREIVGSVAPPLKGAAASDATIAAHFAYGALCGAAFAALSPKPTIATGVAGGVGIWLASYFGWVPSINILRPASRHPASRNALMILAHVVWGGAFAVAQSELLESRTAFDGGPLKDRERERRS